MLKKKLSKNYFKKNLIKKNLIKNFNFNFNFISLFFNKSCFISLIKLNMLYKYLYYIINLKYKNIKLIYNINKFIKCITQRTKDSRMGGGKGDLKYWIIFFKKNSLILKIIINIKNYNIIKYLLIKLKKINLKLNKYLNIVYYIYK